MEKAVEEHIIKIGLKKEMPLTEQNGAMVFMNFLEMWGDPAISVNGSKTRFEIADLSHPISS